MNGAVAKYPVAGDKVVVTSGEFRGRILAIGRVFPECVELQTLDQTTLYWVDFCTVTPAELASMTRPL